MVGFPRDGHASSILELLWLWFNIRRDLFPGGVLSGAFGLRAATVPRRFASQNEAAGGREFLQSAVRLGGADKRPCED